MNNLTEPTFRTISECGLKTFTVVYLVVVYIIAFVGNTLIIAVACAYSEFRKGGILPMFTLAICDLVFVQVAVVIFLANMSNKSFLSFSSGHCVLTAMFGTSLASFVVYHHGMLAVTRFMAICNPVKYKTFFTTRRTAIMIGGVILMVLLLTIITYMIPSPKHSLMRPYYNPSMLCCIYSGRWQVMVYNMIVVYVPPLNVASYCYIRCIYYLRFKSKECNRSISTLDRKQFRLAYTMLINYMVVNINCCLYPVAIILGGDDIYACNYWKRFLSYMVLHNSTVSPIVYLAMSKNIRHKAFRLLTFNRTNKCNGNTVLPANSIVRQSTDEFATIRN